MANWKELDGSRQPFRSNSGLVGAADKIDIWIEYDADRTTPTYTYIRFRGYPRSGYGGATSWVDSFLLFYNPNNNPDDGTRKLYTIKSNDELGGRWDVAECSAIKITKAYNASTFYIQDYWICNNGEGYTADQWNARSDAYDYFNTDRANYVQKGLGSKYYSIESSITKATAVKATEPTITDNGNNTFTIEAEKGTAGTNNKVNSTSLYYRIGSSGSYTKHSSLTLSDKEITAADSVASQAVYAYVKVDGAYNDATSETVYLSVKNYKAPTAQPKPELTYNKSRLTIRENWKFSWDAATKANDSSPVAGYRVAIKRSSSTDSIPFETTSGAKSTVNTTGWNYLDTTSRSITINPKKVGFVAGDTVQFGVKPYTLNGKGNKVFKDNYTYTDVHTVRNAGIVRVKVNGSYKEGQVYVKVNGSWKEANSVHTKVSGAWKESQ